MADDNLSYFPHPTSPNAGAGVPADPTAAGPRGNVVPDGAAVQMPRLTKEKTSQPGFWYNLWHSPETPAQPTDNTREIVETVVFVVTLVLLLKSFVAEAFVIPTGSMATTLWGYQKVVGCPQCGHQFPVNCSSEVDPPDGRVQLVKGCVCPNCRLHIGLTKTDKESGKEVSAFISHTGDRVLVSKFQYELPWKKPERFQVVVFKHPGDWDFPKSGPQKNFVPMNYIKRLIGLPGETIGIHYGDLFVLDPQKSPHYDDSKTDPRLRWQHKPAMDGEVGEDCLHENDLKEQLKQRRGFVILQKPPDKMLAERRLVYDNDHQPKDLLGVLPPRWASAVAGSWSEDTSQAHGFQHTPSANKSIAWLRYRHLLRDGGGRPELITDFMGYNTGEPAQHSSSLNWVGDLLLDCVLQVESSDGQFVLELSKGSDRFRAQWDVASGMCSLRRIRNHLDASPPADNAGEELASRATPLRGPGTYRLRFANVDERLTVWVNNQLPFGEGVSYAEHASRDKGPRPNDLEPASVGAKGLAAKVHSLQLWRDTYYTLRPGASDYHTQVVDLSDARQWEALRSLDAKTLYVQPEHYLCLGDNSLESSDSRSWGLVPARLMLGRALVVYYPFYFPFWPFNAPVNRVGPIR